MNLKFLNPENEIFIVTYTNDAGETSRPKIYRTFQRARRYARQHVQRMSEGKNVASVKGYINGQLYLHYEITHYA